MRCSPQSGRGPLTNPGWCGGSVGGIYSLRILLGHLTTPDRRQHPDFPLVSRFGPLSGTRFAGHTRSVVATNSSERKEEEMEARP